MEWNLGGADYKINEKLNKIKISFSYHILYCVHDTPVVPVRK